MNDLPSELWKVEITPKNVQKENALTLQTEATIYQMGETVMFKACVDCKQNLVDPKDGCLLCVRCLKEKDRFEWRIILSIGIAVHTKNVWVSQCKPNFNKVLIRFLNSIIIPKQIKVYHDEAMKLLGDHDINELGRLFETDPNQLDAVLRTVNFSSYIFKLKAEMEHFNGESRTQVDSVSSS